ncbi:MAG TPA: DUF1344 domain-containing protein [Dongiaceae bacterium]|nr:DUF1344 domain-containing protein [Dongiaceae bacterium]
MRKSLFIAAALCGALASGSAFAATAPKVAGVHPPHHGSQGTDGEDMGSIVSINAQDNTITLADGNVYKLPGYMNARSVHVGEMVSVAYELNASGDLTSVKSVVAD